MQWGLPTFSSRVTGRRGDFWGYERPVHVPFFEHLAERRVCASFGWDYPLFSGRVAGRNGGSCAARFLNYSSLLWKLRPRISAIRIARWSRFGNSVVQIRNAIRLAELVGVNVVQFGEPHPFFSAELAGGFQFVQSDQSASQPILEGKFFLMDAFGLKYSPEYDARLVRDVVRLLLNSDLVSHDPRVHQDDLILHFRSGDVFRKNKPPHRDYGQPPLCYYISAVERERPSRVWLVFEDAANPCVEATRGILEKEAPRLYASRHRLGMTCESS